MKYFKHLIASALSCGLAAAAHAQAAPPPVIDMHVHVGDSLTTLPLLRRHHVVLAIGISRNPAPHQTWDPKREVRFVPSLSFPCAASDAAAAAACYQDSGAFYPDSSWRARRFVLPDPQWVRDQLQSGGFRSLGEMTGQYWGLEPGDPVLEPYYALAEEFDVPVGIHMALAPPGEPYRRPTFRARLGNPLLLEDVLVRHPKLRLWVMHAGHPYEEETIALLSIYPQIYVDISAINVEQILPRPAFHAYLEGLVRAGFGQRILFGSDFTDRVDQTIDAIRSAPFLTEAQKRDILYNNAARFLRLSREEISEHQRRSQQR